MGENVAQKLDKAIASINKGADKKEEMRLMMGPNSDWDRYLTPAPLSIALLGQLILISTDTDFSLQDKKESIKFTLLKYPDSFRASVVQVTNRGWGAFNKAHTCMDQIRLYSGNVDKYVKMAVKFLLNGSPQEVKLMLPKALKSIENIAHECLAAATKVEEEFVLVMEMVAELLEACTRAQGQHQQNLKDVEIQKKVVENHKEALEVEKQQAQENKEKIHDLNSYKVFKTETAKKMYDKSCDDLAKRSKEMVEVLGDLAKINLEKIDHETIVKTLKKGIRALAELREQWRKLVQFFPMRDVIFGQAFQANQIAYVVNSISSVYVEVSDKHLMDRITCLGKLIALDPVNDAKEIQLKREELNDGCKEAQDAIEKIALEKKKEMSEALDKRIGRIETEVEALLPPISAPEAKQIQDRVKAGVAMGKAAIEEGVDDWNLSEFFCYNKFDLLHQIRN